MVKDSEGLPCHKMLITTCDLEPGESISPIILMSVAKAKRLVAKAVPRWYCDFLITTTSPKLVLGYLVGLYSFVPQINYFIITQHFYDNVSIFSSNFRSV